MIKAVSPFNECMAQLEQGKEMPAQGWSLAPWKYLSLAELILVVIGVKLARVDMVLKGEKQLQISFVKSLSNQPFSHFSCSVFMAVEVLL